MINHIIFLVPFLETGGPENIHQVCSILNKNNIDAKILYVNKSVVHPNRFKNYNNKIITEFIQSDDTLFVFPEYIQAINFSYLKCKKALWWLSVDNSPDIKQLDLKSYLKKCGIDFCFSQSKYSTEYLNSWNIQNIIDMPDHINLMYYDNLNVYNERKKVVLFNPKKGIDFTRHIISQNNDIQFIPIQNMTVEQVIKLMDTSMVYIDFGTHPGKDRIPREAAMRGLIVITNKNGSALNDIDVSIPNEFKFDNNLGVLKKINEKLHDCINNFEENSTKFNEYRQKIIDEKNNFENAVLNAFNKIINKYEK